MTTILPFKVNYCPIKKLAIIPFEKQHDKVYKSFELQYLEGIPYGKGYRVIAYRWDNFVDVYDDHSLIFQPNEAFDVAENGLHKHVQVLIENVCFEKINNNQCISFSFKDITQREVKFYLKEFSTKKSIPMNLLAPIGYGSKHPNFLPLFFMYAFDFIRRKKTVVECTIDNESIKIDKFPMPMNCQFRYYARYSNDCELLEFANTDTSNLIEVELSHHRYMDKKVEYLFDENEALNRVQVHLDDRKIDIQFDPSFDISMDLKGSFKILPQKKMGYIEGIYEIIRNGDRVNIKLIPNKGWLAVPNSMITKMLFKPNSIFCRWSKYYEFIEEMDLKEKIVKAKWLNKNEIKKSEY